MEQGRTATAYDRRFLHSLGVSPDDAPPLPLTESEWPRLVEQLRQDLGASDTDLRRAEADYRWLAEAYRRIEDECTAAHREAQRYRTRCRIHTYLAAALVAAACAGWLW